MCAAELMTCCRHMVCVIVLCSVQHDNRAHRVYARPFTRAYTMWLLTRDPCHQLRVKADLWVCDPADHICVTPGFFAQPSAEGRIAMPKVL